MDPLIEPGLAVQRNGATSYIEEYLPTVEGGKPNKSEAARRFVWNIILPEVADDPESPFKNRGPEQMIRTLLDALRDYLQLTDSN